MKNFVLRVVAIVLLCLAGIDVGTSLSNTIRPVGIVIHHSGLPACEGVEYIDKLHRARGFGAFYWWRRYYIGYHYVILPDGSVVEGRPEHMRGAHTAVANNMIGICLAGDFESGSTGPTLAQIQVLIKLCRNLVQKYGLRVSDIHKHRDLEQGTICPGELMLFNELLNSIKARGSLK